jgi:predicted porin
VTPSLFFSTLENFSMKKTLIALAAVAVSSAAMAQVTVSGVLDVQAVNNSKLTEMATGVTTETRTNTAAPGNNGWSTSQVAITVVEDLGNGLKATANINTGLNGGLSAFADRDRSLSLSGGFGTVRIGRFTPASDGSGNFLAGTTSTAGSGDGLTSANHGRRVAMQYTTPNMGGGLVGAVTYASGKADKVADAGKTGSGYMGLNLSYAQGPLSFAAGTSTVTTNVEAVAGTAATGVCLNSLTMATSTVATACAAGSSRIGGADPVAAVVDSQTKDKQMYVGASYNLGVATVVANYKTGKISSAGVNSANVRVTTFGVTVPMGAVTLAANMYTGKDSVAAAATDDGYDLKGNQISARYALSKRRFAYVAQGRADRTRQTANTTVGASSKVKQTTAGLVHSF